MTIVVRPRRGYLAPARNVRAVGAVAVLFPMITAVAVAAWIGPSVGVALIVAICLVAAAGTASRLMSWAFVEGLRAQQIRSWDTAELASLDRHLDEVDPFREG